MQNRLTPLMSDTSPWRYSARELMGVAAFKAGKALKRGTGARGLRAILEEVLMEVMFDLPGREDVVEVKVTESCITNGTQPLLDLDAEQEVDFGRYWRLIVAHWWLVAGGLVATGSMRRTGERPAPNIERILATVLFVDIVESTQRAAALASRLACLPRSRKSWPWPT